MNQQEFFDLSSSESTSRLAEWVDEEIEMEKIICPLNDGHQRAGKRLTDLSVMLPDRDVGDFVWTWYSECLLTDRVLELFTARGFTGFEVKPVKVRFKRKKGVPPRLWELVVTGWAGMASPDSGVKLIEHCQACGYTAYSAWAHPDKLIVPSQWDGSDFFMVWPLTRYIFVTARVEQAIRVERLRGGVLTRVEDLLSSASAIPRISPGRLSYYMPEQRARDLGEAMGIS